jgi:luciferase family oxidoreductase group 1
LAILLAVLSRSAGYALRVFTTEYRLSTRALEIAASEGVVTTPLHWQPHGRRIGPDNTKGFMMDRSLPISMLDFSPKYNGDGTRQALARTVERAQHAEALGYRRFWFTEHHNVPRLTNAAPPVVLAHVASRTRSIRVGSGGAMLPNHSPLLIAEQFGTLAALHPSRIDLGIGRATGGPGSDADTLRMLRKAPDARMRFDADLDELLALLREPQSGDSPHAPGRGIDVPVWLLGSSTASATMAGKLGLPFCYGTHIAPDDLIPAMQAYRAHFRPGATMRSPHAMVSAFIIAADTDAEAEEMMAGVRPILVQWFRKKPPASATDAIAAPVAAMPDRLSYAIVGGPETVRSGIQAMIRRTQADELMIITFIQDTAAAYRSYQVAASVCRDIDRGAADDEPNQPG